MTGSPGGGPGFVHNPPDPPDPNVPDPNPIVVQATLDAQNDHLEVRVDAIAASLYVLDNDSGPEGHSSLRITSVTATKLGGLISIAADGRSLLYTPPDLETEYDPNYRALVAGKDSFTYVVEDQSGHISRAEVSVNLFTPLRGPQSDYLHVFEDETNVALDVLANDQEFSGGTIVAVSESQRGGTVSISADGKKIVYSTPTAFKGYDSFTYTVSDEDGHTAIVNVSIQVGSHFVAGYDWLEVDVNSSPVVLDVLANDYQQLPTDPPRIVSLDLPDNFVGTLTISADGQSLLFEPADGFVGSVSFEYTVRYGTAEHHVTSASGSIEVVHPFLAVDNWFMVDPDSAATTLDVLANDPKLVGFKNVVDRERELRITAVGAGSAGGTIEIMSDGKGVRYTPAAGYTGDETFVYTVTDETGHTDSAQVTVHVALPAADPFNLPRFRHAGELAQFLIDEAVERYAQQFGRQNRSFVPNSGGGGGAGQPTMGDFHLDRYVANGMVLNASYSTTNVQHAGVDEADVVETDGNFIYTLAAGRLSIVDVRDVAHPQLVSVTQFHESLTEMYLQGDRLTLISRGDYYRDGKVVVLDVSDRGEPQLLERTEIDGQIIDTRAIGDRVYVVTQQNVQYPAPVSRVIAETPAEDGSGVWQLTAYETLDEYTARVGATLADLLPQFKTFDAAGELIASGPLSDVLEIHKPISKADGVFASVLTFDVGDDVAGPITSTGLFTNSSDKIYVSPTAVYVLRTDSPLHAGSNGTRILKFAFAADGTTSLEAAGNVDGRVLNQFSLDEYEGLLRIVTTETTFDHLRLTQRTVSHLFVLEQAGTELRVAGALENLAPTEEVKSVRFVGDRAYVVTFRVVDPLFAIDLSDPTDPRIAGAIKIPGFSNYLHPIGEDYVLGFGRDADEITGQWGAAQVSLFYVGDLAHPQLVDRLTLSGADWSDSEAFFDHHAFAYFAESQILSIPISWQKTTEQDDNGDGITDRWLTENCSAAFVFQLDVVGPDAGIEFAGRIDHDSTVRRSVQIGDTIVTISGESMKVHELTDPSVEIAEVYFGELPRDDQFEVIEDIGPTTLDVRANDRPGDDGEPLPIVSVKQPVRSYSYYWLDNSAESAAIGTVAITADGKTLLFTPAADFFGTATFSYTVFDEVRGTQTATVTVNVANVPDAPDAVDDTFDIEPGSQAVALAVLGNDVDFDGAASPYLYPWIGITDVVAVPTIARTTEIRLADTAGIGVAGDFAISNRVMQGDIYSPWLYGSRLQITAVGVGDHGGTVEIDAFGQSLRYTPAEGFEGIETFTYSIATPDGLTDTATVTVRVGNAPAVQVLAAPPEQLPASEIAPTEWTATETSVAEVALPVAAVDRLPVARSVAAERGRQVAFSASHSSPSVHSRVNDLLSLSLRRSARPGQVANAADEAFAELVDAGGCSDELAESLMPELADCWAGF